MNYFAASRIVTTIEVPAWGPVGIRALSLAEVSKLQNETDPSKAYLLAVIFGACDESGKKLFSIADTERLGEVALETLQPVVDAVLAHIQSLNSIEKKG